MKAAEKVTTIATPRALMLAYCAERGISEAQADAAGWKPLDAASTMARAGSTNALGRASFEIPYPDLDGNPTDHSRLRFLGEAAGFKPSKERKRAPKFWQEPGTGTPAYIPPGFARSIGADPSIDVYATEGEVKALAACLHGIPTIAVGGVDTWHVAGDKERLVPGLDAIVLQGRNVGIVYDSDAATNPNVQRAEATLCAELERRGAFPQVIRLPAAKDGGKQGLDDYLLAEGPEAFRRLVASADRLPESLDDSADLFDTEFPPVEFAVKPYFPKGEVVELHGAHGIGKSTIALYACLEVASGGKLGEHPATQGRAVFITMEDRKATLAARVKCWVRGGAKYVATHDPAALAKREKAIRANFRSMSREKAAPLALTATEFGQAHVRTAVADRLVKLIAGAFDGKGADLVVLETASRLHPAGETNEALAVFASALEMIATRTGACVVLVRHVSKEQGRTNTLDSYGGRGGGALADAARSVLSVARDGDKPGAPIRVAHTKATHTARGPDLLWAFEPDGDDVYLRALDQAERTNVGDHRLLAMIKETGEDGITLRDLQRKLGKQRRMSAEDMQAALARLVKEGHATGTDEKRARGRAVKVYRAGAAVVADAS